MKKYEHFREEGWRLAWRDHPFFQGDSPVAKVVSPFSKRTVLADNGGSPVPKEVVFSHVVKSDWLEERLNHTIRYTRKWNDYNIYQTSSLQLYLDEIKSGGYKFGLISGQEMALLMPSKK